MNLVRALIAESRIFVFEQLNIGRPVLLYRNLEIFQKSNRIILNFKKPVKSK